MDETTLSLHPPLRKCWMKRGQRKLIPAPGQQRWAHVFGAYHWRTDRIVWQTARRKNSESFIQFLDYLLNECYPTQKVVLVMDNASYHKSKAALAALSLFADRVQVFWLPPYSPFLNPIERYWLHFKSLASANKLYTGLDMLIQGATRALNNQNDVNFSERFVFCKNFRLTA